MGRYDAKPMRSDLGYREEMRRRLKRRAWKRLGVLVLVVGCLWAVYHFWGREPLARYYAKQQSAVRQQVQGVQRFGEKVKGRQSAGTGPEKDDSPTPDP